MSFPWAVLGRPGCKHEWRWLKRWDWQGVYHNEFYCVHCLAITDRTMPPESDLSPAPMRRVT